MKAMPMMETVINAAAKCGITVDEQYMRSANRKTHRADPGWVAYWVMQDIIEKLTLREQYVAVGLLAGINSSGLITVEEARQMISAQLAIAEDGCNRDTLLEARLKTKYHYSIGKIFWMIPVSPWETEVKIVETLEKIADFASSITHRKRNGKMMLPEFVFPSREELGRRHRAKRDAELDERNADMMTALMYLRDNETTTEWLSVDRAMKSWTWTWLEEAGMIEKKQIEIKPGCCQHYRILLTAHGLNQCDQWLKQKNQK